MIFFSISANKYVALDPVVPCNEGWDILAPDVDFILTSVP